MTKSMADSDLGSGYDACLIGGSIISLFYAHKLACMGRRVLVLEQMDEFGGAWRRETVFGKVNWENGPHFLTEPACAGYIQAHFSHSALERVPDNIYFAWRSQYKFLEMLHSELMYQIYVGIRKVKLAVQQRSFTPSWNSIADFGRSVMKAMGAKYYFRMGSPYMVDVLVQEIRSRGGVCRAGTRALKVVPALSGEANCWDIDCGSQAYRASSVFLTRHSILDRIGDADVRDDEVKKRDRRVIFLHLSHKPKKDFYLLTPYGESPFSFITNLSRVYEGEAPGGLGVVLSLMLISDGFIEDFGGASVQKQLDGAMVPGVLSDEELCEITLDKLKAAGLFVGETRILNRQHLRIDDSVYKEEAVKRIKSLTDRTTIKFLDTQDVGKLIASGLTDV